MADAAPNEQSDQRCCLACNYSLRGLPASGRCPECGEPYEATAVVVCGRRLDRLDPFSALLACVAAAAFCLCSNVPHIGIIFGVIALGLAFVVARRRLRVGSLALQTRLLFHARGGLVQTPLWADAVFEWSDLRKCCLAQSSRLLFVPTKGMQGYRFQASDSRWPYIIACIADVWFEATPDEITAITKIMEAARMEKHRQSRNDKTDAPSGAPVND